MVIQKGGFTLMEVLVSLAVLTVGVTSFGYILDGFNNMRSQERLQVQFLEIASRNMESVIASPPPCRDSTFVRVSVDSLEKRSFDNSAFSATIVIAPVPGIRPVAWSTVYVTSSRFNRTIQFQRLISCKPRNVPTR